MWRVLVVSTMQFRSQIDTNQIVSPPNIQTSIIFMKPIWISPIRWFSYNKFEEIMLGWIINCHWTVAPIFTSFYLNETICCWIIVSVMSTCVWSSLSFVCIIFFLALFLGQHWWGWFKMYIVTFNNYIMALKMLVLKDKLHSMKLHWKSAVKTHAFTFLGLNFTFILPFTNTDKHIFLLSLAVYFHWDISFSYQLVWYVW